MSNAQQARSAVVTGAAKGIGAAIAHVDVSVGGGAWQEARLVGPRNRHSWQWWELHVGLNEQGITMIRARATDHAGRTQPEQPEGNRLGYGSNAIQTISVHVR